MVTTLANLGSWLSGLVSWAWGVFMQIWTNVGEWALDMIITPFDFFIGLGVDAISAISVPALPNYLASVPADVLNIAALLNLGPCLGLITSAWMVRIGLQMIPFTRLGS
jgi:hypothetical protein